MHSLSVEDYCLLLGILGSPGVNLIAILTDSPFDLNRTTLSIFGRSNIDDDKIGIIKLRFQVLNSHPGNISGARRLRHKNWLQAF